MIFNLAKRFLFSHDKKSFRSGIVAIATLGIFFAAAATVLGLGVLSGYQKVYRQAVLNFSAHIIVFEDSGLSSDDQDDIKSFLNKIPYKNDHSSYHYAESLLPSKKGFQPVIFKGIEPSKREAVYPISYQTLKQGEQNQVWVGKNVMDLQPEVALGKPLRFLKLRNVNGELKTQYHNLKVQGSFESGYYDFDSKFVMVPLDMLPKLFLESPTVSGVEVRLRNFDDIEPLKKLLNEEYAGQFHVMSWDELNASLFEALSLDRTVVFGVSFLILLIACLNIFGFNFLFFIQRKREFLILSALGMPIKDLRRLLSVLSVGLGGGASLCGVIVGMLLLAWLRLGDGIQLDPKVYFVDRIPVEWNWPWIAAVLIGSLVFCFLTSVLAGKTVLNRKMTSNMVTE